MLSVRQYSSVGIYTPGGKLTCFFYMLYLHLNQQQISKQHVIFLCVTLLHLYTCHMALGWEQLQLTPPHVSLFFCLSPSQSLCHPASLHLSVLLPLIPPYLPYHPPSSASQDSRHFSLQSCFMATGFQWGALVVVPEEVVKEAGGFDTERRSCSFRMVDICITRGQNVLKVHVKIELFMSIMCEHWGWER